MYDDTIIRLAFNENPLGPPLSVLEAVEKQLMKSYRLTGINRYGDFNQIDMCQTIGNFHKVDPTCVAVGAGLSEIMNVCALAFLKEGDNIITAEPTFNLIEYRAKACGAEVIKVLLNSSYRYDLEGILNKVNYKTKLIYICNPNNPTGTIVTQNEVDDFLIELKKKNPQTIVFFDEAYYEYVNDSNFPRLIEKVKKGLNIIVGRSFSKAYGMAGLRAGYSIAPSPITSVMTGFFHIPVGNRRGGGWVHPEAGVNRLAEAGIIAALNDKSDHLIKTKELNNQGKTYLYSEFERLGLDFIPSEANFILVNVKVSGDLMKAYLCEQKILVQSGSSYGPLFKNWIRVSIGTMEQNEKFIYALSNFDPSYIPSIPCEKTDFYRF